MDIPVKSLEDLGLIVHATRRSSGLRIDDFAGVAGVSKDFASQLERGKPTLQMGLALKVISDLGLKITVTVPDSAVPLYLEVKAKGGLKPLKPRIRKPAGDAS